LQDDDRDRAISPALERGGLDAAHRVVSARICARSKPLCVKGLFAGAFEQGFVGSA